jgi:hypothetical protein
MILPAATVWLSPFIRKIAGNTERIGQLTDDIERRLRLLLLVLFGPPIS